MFALLVYLFTGSSSSCFDFVFLFVSLSVCLSILSLSLFASLCLSFYLSLSLFLVFLFPELVQTRRRPDFSALVHLSIISFKMHRTHRYMYSHLPPPPLPPPPLFPYAEDSLGLFFFHVCLASTVKHLLGILWLCVHGCTVPTGYTYTESLFIEAVRTQVQCYS